MFYTYMHEYGLRYGKASDVNEDGLRLCLNRPEICCNYNECSSVLCILALRQLSQQLLK